MDRYLKLLAKGIKNLTAEELIEFDGLCIEQATALAADPTDKNLASLEAVSGNATAVRAEAARREQDELTRITKAAELLATVAPVAETPDPATPPVDPPAEDPPADPPVEPAAPAVAPVAVAPVAVAPVAVAPVAVAPVAVAPVAPEAVAASARRPLRRPEVRVVAEPDTAWTLAADVQGIVASGRRIGRAEIADAMVRRRATMGKGGDGEKVYVAHTEWDAPTGRRLGDNLAENMSLIAAAVGPEAISRFLAEGGTPDSIVASGGLCAPLSPRYELTFISDASRPVRDSLPGFAASRGGITVMPSPTLLNFAGAIGIHTVANDVSGTTKPCLTSVCGSPTNYQIEAITMCQEFGNMNARAWPESVQNANDNVMANHARVAERELLVGIDAASTDVSTGQILGAARDILVHLGRAAAQYRNRHRMRTNSVLRVILSEWVRDMIREDLARQSPGDGALAVADAEITAYFSARGINVTWAYEDTVSGQDFGVQGPGPLEGWPSTIVARLFHEGMFLFLDGGVLDLGLVRDSSLNSTNDYQIFAETWEGIAPVGLEALKITLDVCDTGWTSNPIDILCSASGS